MLRDPAEEAVQSFPPGLNEVVVEALHHAFHHKLLRQRLRTQRELTTYSSQVKRKEKQNYPSYLIVT